MQSGRNRQDLSRDSLDYSLGVLPLDTTRPTTTEGASEGEVNVLLAIHTHHKAGHVDNLLADAAQKVM